MAERSPTLCGRPRLSRRVRWKRQHRLCRRMLVGRGQHGTESITQQVPGAFLLFSIVVMQVVASHPGAGQHMVLAAIDDVQADPQSLHHGCARTAQVVRRPVAVLAVGQDQGIVMTPSGEGLAVFEASLAVTHLLAHHFYIYMLIILLVRKAPLRISRKGFEFLKEMQGEGGEEDMVVLFLATGAFDVFAGEEPGLLGQICLLYTSDAADE